MNAPLIYLVAGEASGDALGGWLMQAIRSLRPDARFAGVGGEAMQRAGLKSLFPYRDLSIMGFLEVLPHIFHLLARLRETALDIARLRPDVVVTIDSPGFNFRLAKALKEYSGTHSIRRIHYVAPSVWAYKPGRAKKTAELFDGLLALLPFEPPYFEKEGLSTTFVGHPVLWEEHRENGAAFRARHSIPATPPLLLILPGSREGEVKRHLPLFLKAARNLASYQPVVLASPQVKESIIRSAPPSILVVDNSEKQDAFAAANLALSKSGTITLELAAAGVPMVVAHKVNPFSAWLMRRMALISYVSLVNIASKKEIVPELLQERCTVQNITEALQRLAEPGAQQKQKQDCAEALTLLRGNQTRPPNVLAAEAVLRNLA